MKVHWVALVLSLTLSAPTLLADVVHKHGGGVVTGSLLGDPDADPVEVSTTGGTVFVPRDAILSIETGDELTRTLAAKKRRLKRADWRGAIQLSEWALRKGLFENALDLADQALLAARNRPDRPAVALPPDLFRVPVHGVARFDPLDQRAAWILLSSSRGKAPARAMVAEQRLKERPADPGVTASLSRGLKDTNTQVRCAALRVMGATVPEGTIEMVIERMLFDKDHLVRRTAARAVKAYHEEGVIYPLIRAIGQERPELRLAAMDAVEILEDPRAVGALIRHLRRAGSGKFRSHISNITHTSFVSDFDVEIAQASVIAQPIVSVVQHGTVHDVGVAGVFERRVPAGERARVAALLEKLTGQDHGQNVTAWEAWLEAQKRPVEQGEAADSAGPAGEHDSPGD